MNSDVATQAEVSSDDESQRTSNTGKGGSAQDTNNTPLKRPTRPLSAYNLFFRDEREKLLKAFPSNNEGSPKPRSKIGFSNLAKTIAAKWNNLDGLAKREYEEIAAVGRAAYNQEVEAWRKQQTALGLPTTRTRKKKKKPVKIVPTNTGLAGPVHSQYSMVGMKSLTDFADFEPLQLHDPEATAHYSQPRSAIPSTRRVQSNPQVSYSVNEMGRSEGLVRPATIPNFQTSTEMPYGTGLCEGSANPFPQLQGSLPDASRSPYNYEFPNASWQRDFDGTQQGNHYQTRDDGQALSIEGYTGYPENKDSFTHQPSMKALEPLPLDASSFDVGIPQEGDQSMGGLARRLGPDCVNLFVQSFNQSMY